MVRISNDIKLSIVLVDGSSSDGTSQSVLDLYPNVELVDGSGDLYWQVCDLAGKSCFSYSLTIFLFLMMTQDFPDALAI